MKYLAVFVISIIFGILWTVAGIFISLWHVNPYRGFKYAYKNLGEQVRSMKYEILPRKRDTSIDVVERFPPGRFR